MLLPTTAMSIFTPAASRIQEQDIEIFKSGVISILFPRCQDLSIKEDLGAFPVSERMHYSYWLIVVCWQVLSAITLPHTTGMARDSSGDEMAGYKLVGSACRCALSQLSLISIPAGIHAALLNASTARD